MRFARMTTWGAVLLAVLATSCGGRSAAFVSSGSAGMTSTSTMTESGLRLTDADNGRTVTAAAGDRITVILASTYWEVELPTDTRVLSPGGKPQVSAGGPGCPSIPGIGCGTVVASFLALAPGRADLLANRPSCGEALRCTQDAGQWRVHVQVPGPPATTSPVAPTATTAAGSTTAPPVTPTTAAAVGPSSGVEGTVLFGPVCPVERVPPDPQCAPRPGPADLHLMRTDNGASTSGQAGTDGRFSIAVAPGTYLVTAVATRPSPGRGCQAVPAQVTVSAGSFAPLAVSCDTGIR